MHIPLQNSLRCPTIINVCLLLLIFVNSLGYYTVSAATCSAQTNYTCESTDFTLSTCDSTTQICTCKTDYVPIPTGCAPKMAKPIVKTAEGRTNEFLPGALVTLTCLTTDYGSLAFHWTKDGQAVFKGTRPDYVISGADADKTGKFRCQVEDTTLPLVSEQSDEVDIQAANASIVTPAVDTLSFPPGGAASGVELTIKCKDIPYGATYKFSIDSAAATVKVTQSTSNAQIECVLDAIPGITFGNDRSASIPWTVAVATDIASVNTLPSSHVVYKTGASVLLKCLTVPESYLLEVNSIQIAYTFQDSGNPSASLTSPMYTVTSVSGTPKDLTISCTAKYGNNLAKSSTPMTVSFSDNDIPSPTLNASGTEIPVGSRLVLKCGEAHQGVSYTWMKDGSTIPRQYDRIIQFGNFKSTDGGTFSCRAKLNTYEVNSSEVIVRSKAYSLHVLSSTLLLLAAVVSSQIV